MNFVLNEYTQYIYTGIGNLKYLLNNKYDQYFAYHNSQLNESAEV